MPGERGFTGFTVASFLPGTLGFDVVSAFSLADLSAKAAFLSLTTATATVTLTPTHKLPAGPAKALKQASEVAVGEMIWLASPAAGALVQARLYPQHHTPLPLPMRPPLVPRQGARPQDKHGRGRRAAQPAHQARRLANR